MYWHTLLITSRQERKRKDEEAELILSSERESELEKERKQEEEKAYIQAARAKVLERRKKKQQFDASPYPVASSKASETATGGSSKDWSSAASRESPKNGTDRSVNNETFDDIQTGFDAASPRNDSGNDGW